MGFVRKRPSTTPAYNPAVRMQARLWGLFFYLIVLAFLGAVVVFVVRYQPLSTGNFTSSGPVTADGANGIRVAYAGGGTFSFGFLLINDGPVPMTIDKVQFTGPNELLIPLKVEMAEKRDAGAIGVGATGLERFIQFSLGAGDREWIVVRTEFSNCVRFPAGTFETYTQFLVTFKVGPFTKHAWIPLPRNIRVESPSDALCPTRMG